MLSDRSRKAVHFPAAKIAVAGDPQRMGTERNDRSEGDIQELMTERAAEFIQTNEHLQHEIEMRKRTEAALKSRETELEDKRQALEDMNAALRVLIHQRETDKKHLEENILVNIKTFVSPYIEGLKKSGLTEEQYKLLIEAEKRLEDITSPLIRELSSDYIGLSPIEIRVASFIREGKSSKDIAKSLNVSLNTVLTHRYSIRKKTGLKGKKINLVSYLQTLT